MNSFTFLLCPCLNQYTVLSSRWHVFQSMSWCHQPCDQRCLQSEPVYDRLFCPSNQECGAIGLFEVHLAKIPTWLLGLKSELTDTIYRWSESRSHSTGGSPGTEGKACGACRPDSWTSMSYSWTPAASVWSPSKSSGSSSCHSVSLIAKLQCLTTDGFLTST